MPLFLSPPPTSASSSADQSGSVLDRIAARVVEFACQIPLSDTVAFATHLHNSSTVWGDEYVASFSDLAHHTLENFCREFARFAQFSGTLEQYDRVLCLFPSGTADLGESGLFFCDLLILFE